MIAVRGAGSKIAEELGELVPVYPVARNAPIPVTFERYLFCAGLLRAKAAHEQTAAEIGEGCWVNFGRIAIEVARILEVNDNARICVIGSESAFVGSYDGIYADAKRQLHNFVEQKVLRCGQQLVCISPGVIEDCGMAIRRDDNWRLAERKRKHPQQRFLKAIEVAKLVHFVLHEGPYLNNVVIRMNGGEHTAAALTGTTTNV